MAPATQEQRQISMATAASIVVGNMIGTGVFTSLGFQVVDLSSGFVLLLLWLVGGLLALCGALSYAELAAIFQRSGGEYNLLGKTYHPLAGFLGGWVSFTAGFAPPIALAAMAFGRYFGRIFPAASPLLLSCAIVVLVTLVHLRDLRLGSAFQNAFTFFKVLLILVFVGAAWSAPRTASIRFAPAMEDLGAIASAPFAISLLFVMYAYAGWNASTYITDEVRQPTRNVPLSLFLGTTLVIGLYLLLNGAFLYSTPIEAMRGQVEVGHVVAANVFGEAGARWMSGLLCIALVSTISAMTWIGPRIVRVMGEDFALFRVLSRTNNAGIPVLAILTQTALVLVLLITSSFEQVLIYTQMILVATSMFTVLGVIYLRIKAPDLERPYRTWGYPLTPLLFVGISLVTILHSFRSQPLESAAGAATVLLGVPVYYLSKRISGDAS